MGILLINLGTPDAAQAASIRRYLKEFLSDRNVVDLPAWLWQPLLRGVILPLRTRKLEARYRQVWLKDGAPLRVWSQAQARAVQRLLAAQVDQTAAQADSAIAAGGCHVALGMRYGQPSIAAAMQTLQDLGCTRILAVPMYPQYARSTTGTAIEAVKACVENAAGSAAHRTGQHTLPDLRFIEHFYAQPEYLHAVAAQLTRHWNQHGRAERTLLSFHSLPVKMIRQGDPYHDHCLQTATLLHQRLGIKHDALHVAFQSRFGRQQWLQPGTEETLVAWAKQGVKTVEVLCPGFLADCLETLEEIQLRGRNAFVQAGGHTLHYLPCLNDDALWAQGFADIIMRHLQGWA